MGKKHPFDQAVNELFRKLEDALKQKQEADIQITANTAAIRALANSCEDEEVKGDYLLRLEEIGGQTGFKDAIRSVMRPGVTMTPKYIRDMIVLLKKMDLSGYSNAMASIHTTLRRMKDSGDVEEVLNDKGEKAWLLKHRAGVRHLGEVHNSIRTPLETAMLLNAPPAGKKK